MNMETNRRSFFEWIGALFTVGVARPTITIAPAPTLAERYAATAARSAPDAPTVDIGFIKPGMSMEDYAVVALAVLRLLDSPRRTVAFHARDYRNFVEYSFEGPALRYRKRTGYPAWWHEDR
jgi:hypothetical protein